MTRGLAGKRLVNTRAVHQAAALDSLLESHGAVSLAYPCIAILPPEDCAALDNGLTALAQGHYDWLVLTSVNTVVALAERLKVLGLSLAGAAFQTAAIGPATAAAAREHLGLLSFDLPETYTAEALAHHIPLKTGTHIWVPASALAQPTLIQSLAERGGVVETTAAYRTVRGQGGVDVPARLARHEIDGLTFASSSAVTYFIERLETEGGCVEAALTLPAACIGPRTLQTAREHGFQILLHPGDNNTLNSLVEVLDAYFAQTFVNKEQT